MDAEGLKLSAIVINRFLDERTFQESARLARERWSPQTRWNVR